MSLNFHFHRPSPESYQKIYFHEVDKFKDNQLLKRHSKTVFYIFGWTEKYSSRSTQLVIRSYLHRADQNVVVLDWSDYNNEAYFEKSAPASQEVRNAIFWCFKLFFFLILIQIGFYAGSIFLKLFENGFSIEDIHLVGHSLGGQMCGSIGRSIIAQSQGKYILPRWSQLKLKNWEFDE